MAGNASGRRVVEGRAEEVHYLPTPHLNQHPPPPTVTYGLPPMVQQQGSLIIGSTAAQSEQHSSFLTSLGTAAQPH